MTQKRDAFILLFELCAKRRPQWTDGRILAEAIKDKKVKPEKLLPHLPVSALYTQDDATGVPYEIAYNAVLAGNEMPTGQLTQSICEALGIAPHDLLKWCEPVNVLPDFIVEAEVLHAKRQHKLDRVVDAPTKAFLNQIEARADKLSMHYVPALNAYNAQLFEMLATMRSAPDQSAPYGAPITPVMSITERVEGMHTLISDELVKSRASNKKEIAECEQALNIARESRDTWSNTVEYCASQLVYGWQTKTLIENYENLVKKIGYNAASKQFANEPESVHPLKDDWRISGRMRLKDGNEWRGKALLEGFGTCIYYQHEAVKKIQALEQDYRGAIAKQQAFTQEENKWQNWAASSRTESFIRAEAQACWMRDALSHLPSDTFTRNPTPGIDKSIKLLPKP